MNFFQKTTIFIIRFYQIVNPFKGTCRFTPTCSEYAILAIKKYGILKGTRLSVGRILKCRPGEGGVDELK